MKWLAKSNKVSFTVYENEGQNGFPFFSEAKVKLLSEQMSLRIVH